jgi:hypothetical protein
MMKKNEVAKISDLSSLFVKPVRSFARVLTI